MYASIRSIVLITLLAVAPAAVAGAEAIPAANDPSAPTESILRDRVTLYWKARMAKAPEVMDFYAPPELGGPTRSRDVSEFGNVGYNGFEIKGIEMGADSAEVTLEIEPNLSSLPLPEEMLKRLKTRSLTETWILVENTWYKKPIPRGFAPQDGNAEDTRTLGDMSADGEDAQPEAKPEGTE